MTQILYQGQVNLRDRPSNEKQRQPVRVITWIKHSMYLVKSETYSVREGECGGSGSPCGRPGS